MAGQMQFTISIVMIALFTIAILGFMIGFANDNNSAVSITDDPDINILNTNIRENITSFSSSSQTTQNSIVNSTIATGETTTSGTAFALTPGSLIGVVISIMTIGFHKIFGAGADFSIFLIVFGAVLIFMIGLYIWKTWAGRTPD